MTVAPLPVARRRSWATWPVLANPLLRAGYVLSFSSTMTGVVGVAFWAVAAHLYPTAVVGRNSTAISAMMFLGGVSQLNLMSMLARFSPVAGRSTRRLVIATYTIAASVALVVGTVFVSSLNVLSPRMAPLFHDGPSRLAFVVAAMAWTVFVLQDAVLTGLRRTPWVALENTVFAVVKLVLVVALVGMLPGTGVFGSWALALVVALGMTNLYLFRRAIPASVSADAGASSLSLRQIARFSSFDFVGALCWLCATTLVPVLVINEVGATASAYFVPPWLIAYSLYLVCANMGTSLVVETAADPAALGAKCRDVVAHTAKLMLVGAAGLVLVAPLLLRVFGAGYSSEGTTLLRLLALSAVPNSVTAAAVASARAQLRPALAVRILAALCGGVVVLSAVLLPQIGITAVGIAWLVVQTAVAAVLVVRRRVWLPGPAAAPRGVLGRCTRAAFAGAVPALKVVQGVPGVHSLRRLVAGAERSRQRADFMAVVASVPALSVSRPRWVETETDVTVAVDDDGGRVLKLARTARGLAQLDAQRGILDRLAADERLGTWRQLLPSVDKHSAVDGRPVFVETLLRGADGRDLLARRDVPPDQFVGRVLAAMAPLYGLDAAPTRVTDDLLDGLVSARLAALDALPDVALTAAGRRDALQRLADTVRADLVGWDTQIGWVHGDLAPGNVRVNADGEVVGIIDWADARPDGLQVAEAVLFSVVSACARDGREVGEALLAASQSEWLAPNLEQLRPAGLMLDGVAERQDALVALCWLSHAAGNVARSDRYPRNRYWIAVNIDLPLKRALHVNAATRARNGPAGVMGTPC